MKYTWEFRDRPGNGTSYGRVRNDTCVIYGPLRRPIGEAIDATVAQKIVDALNATTITIFTESCPCEHFSKVRK